MRILLLLVVAGVAIGIAGALFSGGETAARDPADREVGAAPSGAAPSAGPAAPATVDDEPAADTATPAPAASGADGPTPAETAGAGSTAEASVGTTTTDPPPADDTAATTNSTDPPPAEEAPASTSAPNSGEASASPQGGGTESGFDAAPSPSSNGGTGTPEATTPADGEPASGATVAEPADTGSAAALVERLRPLVAEPAIGVPDYDRDRFAGWLDTDGDCVNTRHEILQAEAVDFSMNAAGCAVDSGEWFDPYTNRTFTNPRDLDVDHVVALADAWVSGAWAWADELLDNFSNDFGNLNAIAAGENRSKSARGPADYSPTAPGARCDYLVQYATVKIRWQLSITPQDFEVVATGLSGCDVGIVPDTPATAPAASSPPAPPTTVSAQSASGCHPAYEPCLPNLPGDALNCGDLRSDQKPVTVIQPGTDPYRLDRDGDGRGCTS